MVNLFESLLDLSMTASDPFPPTTQSCAETGCAGDDPLSLLGGELG